MPEIESVPAALLVTVTAWAALLVPTIWLGKVRLAGESVTVTTLSTAVAEWLMAANVPETEML